MVLARLPVLSHCRAAAAQISRVSVSTAGVEANGPSGPPSISGTGRYVVFASAATNLVAGDTNGGPTSSCAIGTPTPTASSTKPAPWRRPASASGRRGPGGRRQQRSRDLAGRPLRRVRLDGDQPGRRGQRFEQIYRIDRTTGDVVRVSGNDAGEAGDPRPPRRRSTRDGDVIAFQSRPTIWTAAPSPPAIFVRASRPTSPRGSRRRIPRSLEVDRLLLAVDLRRWQPGRLPVAARSASARSSRGRRFDRATGTTTDTRLGFLRSFTLSASGREVVARGDASLCRRSSTLVPKYRR